MEESNRDQHYCTNDLLKLIKKIANDVYNVWLGKGYCENIYQEAIKIDLMKHNLKYQSELIIPVPYKDYIIGNVRADLVIENKIVVELKALVSKLSEKDHHQLKKYMKLLKIPVGILINFSQSTKHNLEIIEIT